MRSRILLVCTLCIAVTASCEKQGELDDGLNLLWIECPRIEVYRPRLEGVFEYKAVKAILGDIPDPTSASVVTASTSILVNKQIKKIQVLWHYESDGFTSPSYFDAPKIFTRQMIADDGDNYILFHHGAQTYVDWDVKKVPIPATKQDPEWVRLTHTWPAPMNWNGPPPNPDQVVFFVKFQVIFWDGEYVYSDEVVGSYRGGTQGTFVLESCAPQPPVEGFTDGNGMGFPIVGEAVVCSQACQAQHPCASMLAPGESDCYDGIDNDNDGCIDLSDPDCP